MSFNELNAVEHFIIQKLICLRCVAAMAGQGGKNLNAADPTSTV